MRKLMLLCVAALLSALSGCDLEARQRQHAVAQGQPYRWNVVSANPVTDAEGLPLRNPHWFRQSGLRVLELQHGWIVQGNDQGVGLTFIPRPQ
jgi:hypothetical protein